MPCVLSLCAHRIHQMNTIKRGVSAVASLVGVIALITFFVWSVIPKSDPEGARRAIEAAGYRNIAITDARMFGCGEGDFYHTGFTATGPTGIEMSGVVCGGMGKGNTIRTD
jgi:hypothetical protein